MSAPVSTVAVRIMRLLSDAGVRTAFGLPGVHNLAFWRETGPGTPRILGVRHEQTCVYAADGLARATGELGVALTTTGPGAANAAGAFGEAAATGSPVLLIASEISTALARPGTLRGVLHESRDQAAIFEPLAKAVYRPRTPESAVTAVAEAIGVARTAPTGPVYVDIPTDVLDMAAEPGPAPTPADPARPAAAELDAMVAELDAAHHPVLWVGGGVVRADGGAALDRLARRLSAPVVTSYAARGVLPPDHPCLVGLPPHEPEVATLIAEADLMLAVGTGFDGMMTRNWRMPMPPRLAVVDCDPGALATNYRPDVSVLGDARLVLDELSARCTVREPTRTGRDVGRATRDRLSGEPDSAAALVFVTAVQDALPDGAITVADMCIPGYWLGGYARVAAPRRLQYPVGWGTLGYALPASVGAATSGDGPVLAVTGDGGAMFGLSELATLAAENLPVTVLVVDDGGYGMLRYDQDHAGDERRGVDLAGPDWCGLATAFGIESASFDRIDDRFSACLAESLAARRPRVVVLAARLVPPRTTSPRWFETT